MDRCWAFGTEHYTAVRVDGAVTCRLVLRTAWRERPESRTDAALGRAVHENSLFRRHQNDRCALEARLHRQSETSPATTTTDGTRGDLSKTEPVSACTWSSNLSLPASSRCHHAPQSGVVQRHHVYPAAGWLHLPRSRHGLVQSVRAQLGSIHESRCWFLLLGAGSRVASGFAGNLQHRPGIAIYQRGVHRPTPSREHPDQHGRPGPCAGQRLCRTTLEDSEIRRRLSQGLQRSARRRPESHYLLPFLQWTAAASSAELSNAGGRVSKARDKDKEAASRQLLLMSFEGIRKSIRTMEAPAHNADASAHLSDEFPAGYSLTGCSPAALVSASPAGIDDASAHVQVRGLFYNDRSRTEKRNQFHRQPSTLIGPFFCLKNGEYLKFSNCPINLGINRLFSELTD